MKFNIFDILNIYLTDQINCKRVQHKASDSMTGFSGHKVTSIVSLSV